MSRLPQAALLSDGRRLHLQDGPIDLVIEAFGAPEACRAAYAAAFERLTGLLDALCDELTVIRAQVHATTALPQGAVARRMMHAVQPFAKKTFITPMAAVAGAVADEILAALCAAAPLQKAYVNNGGDIALHLDRDATFDIGLVDRPDRPSLFAKTHLGAADAPRGIATSGRHGRSFSRGIADAVTILAADAASADAAATMIANAIDLPGDPRVTRVPADSLQADTDLGGRLVTRDVEPLLSADIAAALQAGVLTADDAIGRGLCHAAALHLQGRTLIRGGTGVVATIGTERRTRDEIYA
jgi:ApbE superfamily uncharacterized protein (UPF0280 family)